MAQSRWSRVSNESQLAPAQRHASLYSASESRYPRERPPGCWGETQDSEVLKEADSGLSVAESKLYAVTFSVSSVFKAFRSFSRVCALSFSPPDVR